MDRYDIEKMMKNCFQDAVKQAQKDYSPENVDSQEMRKIKEILAKSMQETIKNIWTKMLDEIMNEKEIAKACEQFLYEFGKKFTGTYSKNVTSEEVKNVLNDFEKEFMKEFLNRLHSINSSLNNLKKFFELSATGHDAEFVEQTSPKEIDFFKKRKL